MAERLRIVRQSFGPCSLADAARRRRPGIVLDEQEDDLIGRLWDRSVWCPLRVGGDLAVAAGAVVAGRGGEVLRIGVSSPFDDGLLIAVWGLGSSGVCV